MVQEHVDLSEENHSPIYLCGTQGYAQSLAKLPDSVFPHHQNIRGPHRDALMITYDVSPLKYSARINYLTWKLKSVINKTRRAI